MPGKVAGNFVASVSAFGAAVYISRGPHDSKTFA